MEFPDQLLASPAGAITMIVRFKIIDGRIELPGLPCLFFVLTPLVSDWIEWRLGHSSLEVHT